MVDGRTRDIPTIGGTRTPFTVTSDDYGRIARSSDRPSNLPKGGIVRPGAACPQVHGRGREVPGAGARVHRRKPPKSRPLSLRNAPSATPARCSRALRRRRASASVRLSTAVSHFKLAATPRLLPARSARDVSHLSRASGSAAAINGTASLKSGQLEKTTCSGTAAGPTTFAMEEGAARPGGGAWPRDFAVSVWARAGCRRPLPG